jgi:serine/threonine protein kinase
MNILLPTEGFYIFHSKELRKATNNFSQTLKIGEGSAGCVYLGCLPSGKLVAVKKIIKEKKFETFNKEVALLARLRHPNLTALLGYCQSRFAHFLVYEFMGNGDLGRRLLGKTN